MPATADENWQTEDSDREAIPAYLAPPVGFKARRAAQIAALFAARSPEGTIEKLKLIKLIYLTEREHLRRYGVPVLYDEFFSLPHGPICSSTLDCIDGKIYVGICDEYMLRNGNILMAIKKYNRNTYDELSDDAIEVIDSVWAQHGNKTASQLRNFTHVPVNVPEYIEVPLGTRAAITYESVLSAVGRDDAKEGGEFINNVRRQESAPVDMTVVSLAEYTRLHEYMENPPRPTQAVMEGAELLRSLRRSNH